MTGAFIPRRARPRQAGIPAATDRAALVASRFAALRYDDSLLVGRPRRAPSRHERPPAADRHRRRRRSGGRRAAPARDPLQLHLVLRPRDRHPPARRARLGGARHAARRAPHRPLGAHALRGAGRHLGGPAQPLPAGRPARQPAPARPADRGAAPSPGRGREAPHAGRRRGARRRRRRAADAGARRGRVVRGAVSRRLGPEEAHRARALEGDRQGQHQVRRHVARLARHRRHRLARRVPVRRPHARTPRPRWRAWSPAASSSA